MPEELSVAGGHPVRNRCKELADEVNARLSKQSKMQNVMAPCEGERPKEFQCAPLKIPDFKPWISISWGASECDCIEDEDTEVMYLTVCNPYSNLTLSNLTVQMLEVTDDSGKPVPPLPNGKPVIQLVPLGPYCFGDIAPCTCVSRQFMLKLNGAAPARHRINLRGVCFEACLHGDTDACFAFEVCKD